MEFSAIKLEVQEALEKDDEVKLKRLRKVYYQKCIHNVKKMPYPVLIMAANSFPHCNGSSKFDKFLRSILDEFMDEFGLTMYDKRSEIQVGDAIRLKDASYNVLKINPKSIEAEYAPDTLPVSLPLPLKGFQLGVRISDTSKYLKLTQPHFYLFFY